MGVLGLAASAEQGIRFIKEQYPALVLGLIEHLSQIFFGFADIFGDDSR